MPTWIMDCFYDFYRKKYENMSQWNWTQRFYKWNGDTSKDVLQQFHSTEQNLWSIASKQYLLLCLLLFLQICPGPEFVLVNTKVVPEVQEIWVLVNPYFTAFWTKNTHKIWSYLSSLVNLIFHCVSILSEILS